MGSKPATICRFCKRPGVLYKGAHRECKNLAGKLYVRKKRAIPPERWQSAVDKKTTCNTCNVNPRFGKSLDCEGCRKERMVNVKKKYHAIYMKRRRALKVEAAPPIKCACGCGREFKNTRRKYATKACQPPRVQKRKKAPAKTNLTRMPQKFIGSTPPVVEVKIVNPLGITARKVPSLMPAGLRDLFGSGRTAAD